MANRWSRRRLLGTLAGLPLVGGLARAASAVVRPQARVRLGDPAWPSEASWNQLDHDVGGRLIKVRSPLADCVGGTPDAACEQMFKELKNPYYLGDEVGADPDRSAGSTPGRRSPAPMRWPRRRRGRRRGGQLRARPTPAAGGEGRRPQLPGHLERAGFAADLDAPHERDRRCTTPSSPQGCAGSAAPQPAVSLGAGAIWLHAYDAVTTKAGRYVQGGGCMTVGVAGLIQSGGFGSFSKALRHWPAASLLEAEVVTADGDGAHRQRLHQSRPVLGAEGRRRRQLRRRHAPHAAHARRCRSSSAACFATIKASLGRGLPAPDRADRRLLRADACSTRTGASRSASGPATCSSIAMVLPGPDQQQAEAVWRPFFDWVSASPAGLQLSFRPPTIMQRAGAAFLGPAFLKQNAPGWSSCDDRPGAPADNVFWARQPGRGRAGSARLPIDLAAASRCCGRPARAPRRRAVRGGRALGRLAAFQQGPGRRAGGGDRRGPRHGDEPGGRRRLRARDQRRRGTARLSRRSPATSPTSPARDETPRRSTAAMDELRKLVPHAGSYVSETDYFEAALAGGVLGRELRAAARGQGPSTIPTACSSSTTASAARTGAPTDSPG